MPVYAIMNTTSNKFVCGTDKRRTPWHQVTSTENALLFSTVIDAKNAMKLRRCTRRYKVVEVEPPKFKAFVVEETPAKKAPATKATAKKPAAKKLAAKKATAKKAPAKKAAAKKPTAKKTPVAKKAAAKKSSSK